MNETATPEAPTAEATPEPAKPEVKRNRPSAETFVDAWNDVAAGDAVFTKDSAPNKSVKDTTEGKSVPQSRQGVAALLNMEYNAVVNRERLYREKGVELTDMPTGKRGASLDVDALNARIKERAAAKAAAE